MLSTSIYTAMNLSLDRIEDRYHNYLKEQNVEDFAFTPKVDYSKDYSVEDIERIKQNELKDISDQEMEIVNLYELSLMSDMVPNKDQIYTAIDYIFNNNSVNDKLLEEKIKDTQEKYEFEYTKSYSKTMTDDKMLYKALIYDESENIDKPYIVSGRMPTNDDEITLLPEFANIHNIEIGSKYDIGDKS